MAKRKHKKRRRRASRRPSYSLPEELMILCTQAQGLLREWRAEEVISLLTPQLKKFRRYAIIHMLLSLAYATLGRSQESIIHAQTAVKIDPSNEENYLNLSMAYLSGDYPSLAARARQRWLRSVHPSHPTYVEMKQLQEEYEAAVEQLKDRYHLPDTKTAAEAGYHLDQGRWALSQGKWQQALRHSLEAAKLVPGWPPPRNNASNALFLLGRYQDALAMAEQVLQECDPDNIHALSNAIRYSMSLGDEARAREYGQRLRSLSPNDGDQALKQVEGLSLLNYDEDIYRLLQQANKAFAPLQPAAHFYWGVAAANLRRWREAKHHLKRAQSFGFDHPLLEDTIRAVHQKQPGLHLAERYPYIHPSELVPKEAFEEAIRLAEQDQKRGKRNERAWTRLLKRYPQMVTVGRKLLYETPIDTTAAIHFLASLGTEEALETLREFSQGQRGELEDRMEALQVLIGLGVLAEDTEIEMWTEEGQRLIRLIRHEISEEFMVPDYPPPVWEAYEEAITSFHQGDLDAAERAYRRMLALEPRAKEAYNNLAGIYAERGDMDRANEYLDKALEIDPLYVFPRTSRAHQALLRDDIQAAKEWVEPLHEIKQWHPQHFVAYQKVMAHIAIAEREYESARKILENIQAIQPDDPDVEHLLETVATLEAISSIPSWWREMADKYRARHQRKPLPSDPTLADCFALLTKGDMTGIRRVLRISGISALKKAELTKYLMEWISDPYNLDQVVSELKEEEKEALRDMLAHGGVMDWQAFADRHGHDLEESPYLEFHAEEMETVMGRLRARALLFEGTADGNLIIAIPRELRPLLQDCLASP